MCSKREEDSDCECDDDDEYVNEMSMLLSSVITIVYVEMDREGEQPVVV